MCPPSKVWQNVRNCYGAWHEERHDRTPSTRYGVPTEKRCTSIRFTTFEDQPTSGLNGNMPESGSAQKKRAPVFTTSGTFIRSIKG